MNNITSQSSEKLKHPIFFFIAVFGAIFALTAAAVYLQNRVATGDSATVTVPSSNQSCTPTGEERSDINVNSKPTPVVTTNSEDMKICFIRQLSCTGDENYAMDEQQEGNGTKTYGYRLNKSLDQLADDGSILFSDYNIVSAKTVETPNYNEENEYSVSLELSESDAVAAIDAAITLLGTSESIGVYYNNQIYAVESVTDLFGDGALIIPGFSTQTSADAFVNELHLCAEKNSDPDPF